MTRAEIIKELYRRFAYMQKSGRNPHFKYTYVRESDLKSVLNEAARDLGLVLAKVQVAYTGTERAGWAQVRLYIEDSAGNELLVLEGVSGGQDSSDKAPQKAQVGAVKNALLTGLMVASGDEPEADGRADDAAAEALLATLTEATDLKQVVALKGRVGTFQGGPRFEELRVAYYDAVRRCGGQAPSAGTHGGQ